MCLSIHTRADRSEEAIKHDMQEQQRLLAGVLSGVSTQGGLQPPRALLWRDGLSSHVSQSKAAWGNNPAFPRCCACRPCE